jgi:hypothetical protein
MSQPLDPAEIMRRAQEALQASISAVDDEAGDELEAQNDGDQDDEDTASRVTSEDDDDADEDDEQDTADGSEVDSDEDAADDDDSVQDPEDAAADSDDSASDEPGKKKKRRGGALNRIKAENEQLQAQLTELKASMDSFQETQTTSIMERLQAEREENERLRTEQAAQEAEADRVDRVVTDFIGQDAQIQELIEAVENGNPLAASQLKDFRTRRNLLNTLMAFAKNVSGREATKVYREATKKISGLDREIVDRGNIPEVIEHVDAVGYARGEAAGKADLERLTGVLAEKDKEIDELKDKLLQAKKGTVGKGKRQISAGGGKSVAPGDTDQEVDDLFDPVTRRFKPGMLDAVLKPSSSRLKLFG